jgi:Domain of unknown function (DUF4129)
VAAVTFAGLLLLITLLGLAARSGSYARELPREPPATTAPYSPAPFTLPSYVTAIPTTTAPPEPVNPVTGWVVLGLVLLLAAGVLAVLARTAWQYLTTSVHRRPEPAPMSAARPADPGMPAAVDRALLAVEQPDAREAVVRAWLVLGEAAAAAGTPARTSETATEYAERLAAAHGLPAASVHRLAELYREARFSAHPVGDPQRGEARTELARLRTTLAGHRSPVSR